MQVLEVGDTDGTPFRYLRDRAHEITVDRVATGVTVNLYRRTSESRWVQVNGFEWTDSSPGTELHRGVVGATYKLTPSAAGPVAFVEPVDGTGDVEEA